MIGMALTAVALLEMPLLGRAKHRLGSAAASGEGTQNYLRAAQAAAVLAGPAIAAVAVGRYRILERRRLLLTGQPLPLSC